MLFNGSAHLAQCTAGRCLSVSLLKGSSGCWQTHSKWEWLGRAWGHRGESPSSIFSSIHGDFFPPQSVKFHLLLPQEGDNVSKFFNRHWKMRGQKRAFVLRLSAVIRSHRVWLGFCNPFCSYFGSFTGYLWICYTGKAPDNAGDLQGHGKKKCPWDKHVPWKTKSLLSQSSAVFPQQ